MFSNARNTGIILNPENAVFTTDDACDSQVSFTSTCTRMVRSGCVSVPKSPG